MPNFDEISQTTSEIKLLPVSENRRPPYWNSISCIDIDLCIVIDMSFCIYLPNFVVIGRSAAELWRHIHFQYGSHRVGNLLPGWALVTVSVLEGGIYMHIKFRWDISIHGWDKTTSGFGKRTTAILLFYFRLRYRPMYSYRRVIFHLPVKLRSNRTIFKMVAIESATYFRVGV